jgi:glucokinase
MIRGSASHKTTGTGGPGPVPTLTGEAARLIRAGIVEDGAVIRSTEVPTPSSGGPEKVLDAIARAVLQLNPSPRSVGVAIPGEVDPTGRCWGLPNVPGFKGVALGKGLSDRLRCPVAVENDATTAALGEYLFGHGARYPSFLMITLGTGIGGGLVIGGQLYPGSNGFAGEIGHINVDPSDDAPACGCGKKGCLETFSGTNALKRKFREEGGPDVSGIKEIAESARRGEAPGLAAFRMMGLALGHGLANIQNVLDLNALVFTGGISGSFDLIEPLVREGLRRYSFADPPAEVPLVVSELGSTAGVIGAAYLTQISSGD